MPSNLVIATFKGRPINSFERLSSPFDIPTWACICTCILIGIFVIVYLLNKPKRNLARALVIGRKTKYPIMDLLSVIFTNPVKNPEVTFTKFVLMNWIILFLILRVAYQANLYSILKSNKSKTIPKNLKEITADGYTLYSTIYVKEFFMDIPELKCLIAINNSYIDDKDWRVTDLVMLDWLISQKASSKKGVIISEEAFYYYRINNPRNSSQLTLIKGIVLTQSIAFSLRKHSIYKPYFDEMLEGMLAGGLIDYWRKNHSWFKGKKLGKSAKKNIILSVDKISFALSLVIIGGIVASVVFFFEYFEKQLE